MAYKNIVIIPFAEIFHFAEEYGVGWNAATDLFFGNVFEYRSTDPVEYNGEYEGKSVEDISAMPDGYEKADAILSHFLKEKGLDGKNVMVDSH
ncbi:MAG: hypothetical protein ACRC91_04735 [Aeromonas sp.]